MENGDCEGDGWCPRRVRLLGAHRAQRGRSVTSVGQRACGERGYRTGDLGDASLRRYRLDFLRRARETAGRARGALRRRRFNRGGGGVPWVPGVGCAGSRPARAGWNHRRSQPASRDRIDREARQRLGLFRLRRYPRLHRQRCRRRGYGYESSGDTGTRGCRGGCRVKRHSCDTSI